MGVIKRFWIRAFAQMGRAITILEQGKFPTRHIPITALDLPTLPTKGEMYSIWNIDDDELCVITIV